MRDIKFSFRVKNCFLYRVVENDNLHFFLIAVFFVVLNCGKFTKTWLAKFFTNILQTGYKPHQLKERKNIALLKPGKTANTSKNFRPITLLPTIYKLLLEKGWFYVTEQTQRFWNTSYRPNRSCSDQILSHNLYRSFQQQLKASALSTYQLRTTLFGDKACHTNSFMLYRAKKHPNYWIIC